MQGRLGMRLGRLSPGAHASVPSAAGRLAGGGSGGNGAGGSGAAAAWPTKAAAVIASSSNAGGVASTSGQHHYYHHHQQQRGAAVVARARRSGAATKVEVPTVTELPPWQEPLRVVRYPDPRLRAPNARYAGAFDGRLRALADAMFKVMYQDDGVGLAAPQVGVNVRLMVFNETAVPGDPAETVLVNPAIVDRGRAVELDEEGCLSFPGIYADVERAAKIEVRYQDLSGEPREMTLKGFVARVFQHEHDHLLGVLFHDRMRADQLERVRPRLVAMEEAFLAANPGAAVQRVPPPGAAGGAAGGGGGAAAKQAAGGFGGTKGFGARR